MGLPCRTARTGFLLRRGVRMGRGRGCALCRRRMTASAQGCIAAVLVVFLACRTAETPRVSSQSAVFVVEVAGLERFRIELAEPERIAEADALLKSGGRAGVGGTLLARDGGFNAPYHWHLDPGTVRFSRARDGPRDTLPSDVEKNLDHWLHEVGTYSPWASRIVARER